MAQIVAIAFFSGLLVALVATLGRIAARHGGRIAAALEIAPAASPPRRACA